MTHKESREDDAFYALRAKKRAEKLERNPNRDESASSAKLANFAGWIAEDDAMPLRVLSELGRIEDEGTFWKTVEWYFERADHIHLLRATSEEEIAEDIRRMREEGRALP